MMILSLQLIIFLFPLAYSPGPGNMFFAANGAAFGFKATLNASLGYHVATWVVTAAVGFGFGEILNLVPEFFTIIKYLGSLYIFSLAFKLFKAGQANGQYEAKVANFLDGFLIMVLNPKAYMIIAVMFSQFLSAESVHKLYLVLFITTVFTINNFTAFSAWTLLGEQFTKMFTTKQSAKTLNQFFAIVLALVGVWMLIG